MTTSGECYFTGFIYTVGKQQALVECKMDGILGVKFHENLYARFWILHFFDGVESDTQKASGMLQQELSSC